MAVGGTLPIWLMVLKWVLALISILTALVFWPYLKRALALPSVIAMEQAHAAMESDLIAGRQTLKTYRAQKDRVQDALLQIATTGSHDLRAPLRHVRVFAELAKREEQERLSASGRDYLERIETASARMQALIDAMVDYARLVNTPLALTSVHLGSIMDDILKDRQTELIEHGLRVQLSPIPPVQAEPAMMRRVLEHLLGNVINHAGGCERVMTLGGDVSGDEVCVQVTDNGPGIDPKYEQVVFDFLRSLEASPDPERVAGMGLAVSKQIIEAHGGRIWLDPDYHQGARIMFTLPKADTGQTDH